MTSVKVKFRVSTVSGRPGVIYYQVIQSSVVRHLTTNYRIYPNEWDAAKATVILPSRGERRGQIIELKAKIVKDIERMNRLVKMLKLRRPEFTADDVVDAFKEYCIRYSLFSFAAAMVERLKERGHQRTAETYVTAINSFRRFMGGCDIMLDCVDREVILNYESFLLNKGVTLNTVSFYMRILRAVYNRAVECDAVEDIHPFRHAYTGVEKTSKRAIAISKVRYINRLDLSSLPALEYARDMFMMSFYLRGMSFVDMSFLKKADLHNGYICYRRRKTGQMLRVAWTTEMQSILEKYPANPNDYLLPIITRSTVNVRSAYRNINYSINRNLKKVGRMVGLDVPLTMYVARHSWASAAHAKGVPVSIISEGMGHGSEMTTRIYLASLDTSAVDKVNARLLKLVGPRTC